MTANLDGVWLKVSRAKKHIGDLEAAIVAFHETKPYLVVAEDDPQTGKRIAKIKGEPPPIPNEVSLILGDAVHAIRTSLDYFAFAAVPASTKDTAFPVWRQKRIPTARDLKSLVASKVGGASKRLTQTLCALQPYQGGHEENVWLIDHLDVVDKHHLLVTIGVAHSAFAFDIAPLFRGLRDWTKDLPAIPIGIRPADRYPVQNGTALFSADPELFEKLGELHFTFDVAFGSLKCSQVSPLRQRSADWWMKSRLSFSDSPLWSDAQRKRRSASRRRPGRA
jgi:hypothetical protein